MNKVASTSYPGWNNFPVYQCNKTADWYEITSWMHKNGCEPFLLSSGSTGYVFQVRENHEWFALKWL